MTHYEAYELEAVCDGYELDQNAEGYFIVRITDEGETVTLPCGMLTDPDVDDRHCMRVRYKGHDRFFG